VKAKVLVTGAGALLGQGVIKSLRLPGPGYHVVAVDPDPRAVGLYWADTSYLIPSASAPDYLESMHRLLGRERPDAVLVGTDVELGVFAMHRRELEARYGTQIVVCPPEAVEVANDKWLTFQFLKAHGFPHPRTALPEDVGALLDQCGFPLIVKPRVGGRSIGVHRVSSEHELNAALRAVDQAVVQECVASDADEFTSGVLTTEGRVHAVVTMRRDLKDGNTYRAYVEPETPFDGFLATVASALRGHGSVNFQFRVDKGVPKIFEINARFSGTTPLRAYSGFNEVDYLLRYLLAGEPIPSPSLRRVTVLRYWDEIVVEPEQVGAMSKATPRHAPAFERPFVAPRREDDR